MRLTDQRLVQILFFGIILLYLMFACAFPRAYILATYEDLLGEWAQFYFFAFALYFSLGCALAETASHRPFFCCLALACFYVLGEEISWGQRLIGFDTPLFFREHNLQQETNLHNFFTGPYSTLLKRCIEAGLAAALVFYGCIYPARRLDRWEMVAWLKRKVIPAPPAALWPFFCGAALFELRPASFNEAEIAELLLAFALTILALDSFGKRGLPHPPARPQKPLAPAILSLFAAGVVLAAMTTALCCAIPRLQEDMESRFAAGMEKFASRYERFESWQNAALLYGQLLKRRPKECDLLRRLAGCHERMGHVELFKKYNREALLIDMIKYGRHPTSIPVNLSLHETFRQAGNRERALFHLENALAAGRDKVLLEPQNGRAFYWLGKSQLTAGDRAAARRQFARAVALNPSSTTFRKALLRAGTI